MVEKILNLGVTEAQTEDQKKHTRLTNIVLFLNGTVIALPFIILSLIYFPSLAWIPSVGLVAVSLIMVMNAYRYHTFSRVATMFSALFLAVLYHMYLVNPGEQPVTAIQVIQLAFSLIPFLLFSIKEYGYLLLGVIVAIILNTFITDLAYLIQADVANVELYRTGWLGKLIYALAIILASSCIFALSFFNNQAEQNSSLLIRQMDDQNDQLKKEQQEREKNMNALEQAKQEEDRRKWIIEGVTRVNNVLRSTNELEELAFQTITELVTYAGLNQGTFFIKEEDEKGPLLNILGTYAYDRRKYIEGSVRPGIGLVGQVYLEGEYTYIEQVPENYIHITSGMGDAPPNCLIIIPMIYDGSIEGILEIAGFNKMEDQVRDFLLQAAEIIAANLNTVKRNEKTRKLLEESQHQTQALQAQEEEMRQNMEEMQATQEEMARTQRQLAEKEAYFDSIINNTNDSIIAIDRNYTITVMNETLKKRYRGTSYEVMKEGVNALEMLGDAAETWKGYYDKALLQGEDMMFTLKSSVEGEDTYREYEIRPIRQGSEIIGASIFSRDVTKENAVNII